MPEALSGYFADVCGTADRPFLAVRDAGGEMRVQGTQNGGAARVGKALARGETTTPRRRRQATRENSPSIACPDAAIPPSRTRHRTSFWGRHA